MPPLNRYVQKMKPIDYSEWVDRARRFTEELRRLPGRINVSIEIEPPIDEKTLEDVSKRWPNGLPAVLKKLWSNGSSSIVCKYWWMPPDQELAQLHEVFESNNAIYGGVRFLPAAHIFPGNFGVDPDDEDMAECFGTAGLELWCRCAVFLQIGNGDCLGLDPESDINDPAVVYLVHDDDSSSVISPSFTEFLIAWEQLSYIGPEFWLLDYWLDADRGLIDTTKHKTDELRALLTPRPHATMA